jgi:hypothetical protein
MASVRRLHKKFAPGTEAPGASGFDGLFGGLDETPLTLDGQRMKSKPA